MVEPKTVRDITEDGPDTDKEVAGLVLFFAGGTVKSAVFPIVDEALTLGRGGGPGGVLDDPRMSRKHATVWREADTWYVRDEGSTNGTFIDGARVRGTATVVAPRVLRLGGALFAMRDGGGLAPVTVDDGLVAAGALSEALVAIRRAARIQGNLLIYGESGTGKEVAARAYHDALSRSAAPFVAVNCATVAPGLAERLLFGTRKGAYSGAEADAEGYLQAANGGTLFLDEVAELELGVQAKLLRTLETGDVLPLGATKATRVSLSVVCATHSDLRLHVAQGRFREDLYFRLCRPAVYLPPLRSRVEEISFHIERQLQALQGERSISADATFVEACALRAWPGNVRELLGEVRRAGHAAADKGREVLAREDLDAQAGTEFSSKRAASATLEPDTDDPIREALELEGGNVSAAARRLGVSRNHVRRWLDKRGLDAKSFRR